MICTVLDIKQILRRHDTVHKRYKAVHRGIKHKTEMFKAKNNHEMYSMRHKAVHEMYEATTVYEMYEAKNS
jgi:hypothetical protein